ncbi:MAG: hypothetical protein ACK4L4_06760 [Gemmobacter sp.]
MSDAETAMPPLSIDAADREGWIAALDAMFEDLGHSEPLGHCHHALFADEGTTLLVTFDEAGAVRAEGPGRLPHGFVQARAKGWSWLGLLAEGATWWRDPAVWRYIDRLVDDAFFEDFDRVLFYGAGQGGYAAAAYSVASPGAGVLAIAPQATLSPALAGWDPRFRAARRLDFTGRYGFAPDMTEGAGRVSVIFDPMEREDAMHAALFHRPWSRLLPARHFGKRPDAGLRKMGVMDGLVEAAMEGRLDDMTFAEAMRVRRNFGPYLRHLLFTAREAGHPGREAMICRSVTRRLKAPSFRRRLAELAEPTGPADQ